VPISPIGRRNSQLQSTYPSPRHSLSVAGTSSSGYSKDIQHKHSSGGLQTHAARLSTAENWPDQNRSSGESVILRNSSIGMDGGDSIVDKGPPRLNLYRTSQILSKIPRAPKVDDILFDVRRNFDNKHVYECPPPPPPAPIPNCSQSSFSQPSTPRNPQKLFLPTAGTFGPSVDGLGVIHRRERLDLIMYDLSTGIDSIVFPPAPPKRTTPLQ